MEAYYTVGLWRAKEGRENELAEVWKDVGDVFARLPDPPTGIGTLLRSIDDPRSFVSFGAWPSLEAINAMRENGEASVALRRLQDVCEEARPGTFRVVARVSPTGAEGPP